MALTSSTDSLSTIPATATPNHLQFLRAYAVWIAALAVWLWDGFEPRITGKHLCAIAFGMITLNTALIALAVLR